MKEIIAARSSVPIHIHIAEQVKEIELIQSNLGARPVEWLLNNVNVDSPAKIGKKVLEVLS